MKPKLNFVPDPPDATLELAQAIKDLAQATRVAPVVQVAAPEVTVQSAPPAPAPAAVGYTFDIERHPVTQRIIRIIATPQ